MLEQRVNAYINCKERTCCDSHDDVIRMVLEQAELLVAGVGDDLRQLLASVRLGVAVDHPQARHAAVYDAARRLRYVGA